MKKKFTELDITAANIINREWKQIRKLKNKESSAVDPVDMALDDLLEIFKNELGAAAAQVEKDRLDNPAKTEISLNKKLTEKEVLGEPYVFLNKTLLMLFLKSNNWKTAYEKARIKIADVIRKKNPKGHAHSKAMAIYASDALETSTPWENWELKIFSTDEWAKCTYSPSWEEDFSYRHVPSGFVSKPIHEVAIKQHVENKDISDNPKTLWKISVENNDRSGLYFALSPKKIDELESMAFSIFSSGTPINVESISMKD